MNVEFDKSFIKSLVKVKSKSLNPKIEKLMSELEQINSNTFRFIIVAHRKDIYKFLP